MDDTNLKEMRDYIVEHGGVGVNTVSELTDAQVRTAFKKIKKETLKKPPVKKPPVKKPPVKKASGGMLKKPNNKCLSKLPKSVRNNMGFMQKGGMIGAADMSAKKTSAPKKKKMPQYYMGGGMIKKGKKYAYGGRVAKYKG